VSGTQAPTFCSPIPQENPEDGGNKLLRNSNTCNNPHWCQDRKCRKQKTALTSPNSGSRQDKTFHPTSIPFLQATSTVNGAPPGRPPSVHGAASVSRHDTSRHVMSRHAKRKYVVHCNCLQSTKLKTTLHRK